MKLKYEAKNGTLPTEQRKHHVKFGAISKKKKKHVD